MPNLFNSIKLSKPGSSTFDLSHDVKLSFNMGALVPVYCEETIPGDRFNIACDTLIRFAPLVSPVMHRIDMRVEYFYVPNRLIWEGWEQYISNNSANTPDPPPAFPVVTVDTGTYTQLHDYLGIPVPPNPTPNPEVVNALPFAAYQMIYNEYYRDQNLVPTVQFELTDGDNTTNGELIQLRNRAWEHDYFTSALPFAQKGQVVAIPVGAQGDVSIFKNTDNLGDPGVNVPATAILGGAPEPFGIPNIPTPDVTIAADSLYADLNTNAAATTINDLRRATKLQEWLEKMARGGSRLIEVIRTFFGVKSSDQRLDRPEYIVGTKSPVIISEVLSTAETTTNPQGNLAGHAVSVNNGNYGGYFCEEHGFIIGIMSVMPKTAYQQGLEKFWTKHNNPFQYYWPQFEHIGEQAIENREIYAYQPTNIGDDTFGYIPRYSEYKFHNNRVCGDFRTSLDFWHMSRIFGALPVLNEEFIELDPVSDELNRIFAVTDPTVQKLYAHILHKISARRLMSKYGNPMSF